MVGKRKFFCYTTAKVHGGRGQDKTLGIHFKCNEKELLKFLSGITKAMEYGKNVDITVFKYKPLKNNRVRVTVTSAK